MKQSGREEEEESKQIHYAAHAANMGQNDMAFGCSRDYFCSLLWQTVCVKHILSAVNVQRDA